MRLWDINQIIIFIPVHFFKHVIIFVIFSYIVSFSGCKLLSIYGIFLELLFRFWRFSQTVKYPWFMYHFFLTRNLYRDFLSRKFTHLRKINWFFEIFTLVLSKNLNWKKLYQFCGIRVPKLIIIYSRFVFDWAYLNIPGPLFINVKYLLSDNLIYSLFGYKFIFCPFFVYNLLIKIVHLVALFQQTLKFS